ncbi:MAG: phage tail tape measure protein [Oscillospiraceae bacterium]|nr:phage tail tape measure protein [Oscillospiraceae bacterium]MDY6208013.1 phage tail tape measure protein [Oscillospiraceae bacterium]
MKRQYKQAIAQVQTQTQPLNVSVSTANAQKQMVGFSNTIKATKSETETLGGALQAALRNTGLVVSSQTALQLVRKAAQEATEAVKEYDKYATNLSIITNGTRADSDNIIADLSEKSFEFKVDISELENAYETLLRTGKAAGELDDYLKSTVFLSKIGFEDMETSASNLVTIGNAFKLQSDEIENVVSSLVALDTASNTVAGKLSTAMGKTAQNAQLAGLSIDELGAIISGLRDTTGKTEDAIATSINGILTRLYTSLDAPTFDNGNGNTDPNKAAFDELYAKWNHDVEMNRVTQEEYINWLDGAYKQYFSDLTKYQEEYNKYEAEVYNARKDREQDLFDKKIENYKKLSDNALEKYVDGDGNELTVNASFDYARSQINGAIAETQSRINELSLKTGFEDEIENLKSDLEGLYDTLDDINKKEIESQKDYIDRLKDEYSDLMDERISEQKNLADNINEA